MDEVKRLDDVSPDASSSEVEDAVAALVTNDNYGRCKAVATSYENRIETCTAERGGTGDGSSSGRRF